MALICCSECGKEISDQAKVCPNCGFDVKQHTKQIERTSPIGVERSKRRNLIIAVCVGIVLVIVAIFVAANGDRIAAQNAADKSRDAINQMIQDGSN